MAVSRSVLLLGLKKAAVEYIKTEDASSQRGSIHRHCTRPPHWPRLYQYWKSHGKSPKKGAPLRRRRPALPVPSPSWCSSGDCFEYWCRFRDLWSEEDSQRWGWEGGGGNNQWSWGDEFYLELSAREIETKRKTTRKRWTRRKDKKGALGFSDLEPVPCDCPVYRFVWPLTRIIDRGNSQ